MASSYRKSLLVAAGIVAAGGTAAAYMHLRRTTKQHSSLGHYDVLTNSEVQSEKKDGKSSVVKKSRQKKGGLRSLHVLARILLSSMGQAGARDLFALVTTVVSFSF